MKKSMAFVLMMFSMIFLSSASITSSLGAEFTKVGVKVGDSAVYAFESSDPRMDGAEAFASIQNTEGTLVTVNGTIRYPNGTTQVKSTRGDISLGQNSSYYLLICANLTQGDPIYSGSDMKITETISASVLGASRDINHLRSENIIASLNVYWDKQSGLMVKLEAGGLGYWITVTMTNTSVWSSSGGSPGDTNNTLGGGSFGSPIGGIAVLLVVGGVATVAVTGTIIVLRRRRK